jgi:hypothetical protein
VTAGASDPHIALVVEGIGDRGAVPLLLRRHLEARGEFRDILGKPIPFNGKGSATVEGGVERYVQTASLRPGCRGVLVVLDADREPSCEEGPRLFGRAQGAVGVPVVVALAERDYEDWIYASVETLGLGDEAWESGVNGGAAIARLLSPKSYIKPTWQPRLTGRMDLQVARSRSASLGRLLDRFDSLCLELEAA